MDLKEFRLWFDERFFALLQEKIETFSGYSDSSDVLQIAQYAKQLASDGKRFRPYLVACPIGFEKEVLEKHFLLFTAVELLHVFALIHDDIMDNADVRHAVPCAHKKFEALYGVKVSESVGILLGDIVFAWAYECFLDYNNSFEGNQKVLSQEFSRLVSEVTHGQLLDVLSPVQPPLSKELILQKMTLKTGRYSFVQPLRLGAVVSGRLEELGSFIETYGIALGVGFQLQDDLLDALPQEQSGKTPFLDIEAGQQTMISWYMEHEAKEEDRVLFKEFFRRTLSVDEKQTLGALLERSGAISYVKDYAQSFFATALGAIDTTIREGEQDMWRQIVETVTQRKK